MAVYTVKILGQCSGGEHITASILRDGVAVKKLVLTKTELLDDKTDIEQALIFFCRQAIKTADAKTVAAAKAAVEAAKWVV